MIDDNASKLLPQMSIGADEVYKRSADYELSVA